MEEVKVKALEKKIRELETELADKRAMLDVLALPVVGIVDTRRSAQMTDRLLNEVVRTRARQVIVDLTGVELIDTSTADRFLRLARAVQLLGARCIVTGIQPAVSETRSSFGVEFAALETHRNLKNALQVCIARNRAAEERANAQSDTDSSAQYFHRSAERRKKGFVCG